MYIPDKVELKSCKHTIDCSSGTGSLLVLIPGTYGSGDGRYVVGGAGWFANPKEGDYVKFSVTDEDDKLGNGVGFQVASYTEQDLSEDMEGWFICEHSPLLKIKAITSGVYLPSGYYLKIECFKGPGGNQSDTFRINIKWGQKVGG